MSAADLRLDRAKLRRIGSDACLAECRQCLSAITIREIVGNLRACCPTCDEVYDVVGTLDELLNGTEPSPEAEGAATAAESAPKPANRAERRRQAGQLRADRAEIRRALALIAEPDAVSELRALTPRRGICSGYFRDLGKLAREAARCSDDLLSLA